MMRTFSVARSATRIMRNMRAKFLILGVVLLVNLSDLQVVAVKLVPTGDVSDIILDDHVTSSSSDEGSSQEEGHSPATAGQAETQEISPGAPDAEKARDEKPPNPIQALLQKLTTSPGDPIDDAFYDPFSRDPSCMDDGDDSDCFQPPDSTIETQEKVKVDASCFKGNGDGDVGDSSETTDTCPSEAKTSTTVDKHWGGDPKIALMRETLQQMGAGNATSKGNKRPPIFLIPGLASTRLVAWKYKRCAGNFMTDIKVQDYVWLNLNLIIQMGTLNVDCMKECLSLGLNQTDTDDLEVGCKLRPDEGLDSIASLAPGGIGSNIMIGGTNTVYAWLIQWLADNLGYDVTNLIGFPYDWRLSPDKMEERDGFLTSMRRRMEAAVATSGEPAILVAHSMGNLVFRYFLEWLRIEMREEAYQDYVKRVKRQAESMKQMAAAGTMTTTSTADPWAYLPGWMTGVAHGFDGIFEWLTANDPASQDDASSTDSSEEEVKHEHLWELAIAEGDANWIEWLETHIWTYVGLSAPMLGAVNPLRSVISGENMGLPLSDELARTMETTFGSTNSLNPVTTKSGFCDDWEDSSDSWGSDDRKNSSGSENMYRDHKLACLDDIMNDIETSTTVRDPWKYHPTLKAILRDRVDWDTEKPMIHIDIEQCGPKQKPPCVVKETIPIRPQDVQDGAVFETFHSLWKEEGEPLLVKRDQLFHSFVESKVPNILNHTWDRPLIKHVIMAYGVDMPTEIGYRYAKRMSEGEDPPPDDVLSTEIPQLKSILFEEPHGKVTEKTLEQKAGFADVFIKKREMKQELNLNKTLNHSGDGSVPYLSLAWTHTWLLHAARAKRVSPGSHAEENGDDRRNALDHIEISHRPQGATMWKSGPPPPRMEGLAGDDNKLKNLSDDEKGGEDDAIPMHGTRYKPEMIRYHNVGISRTTGIEYTTTIIEASDIEHKETTRNYDILAAVFTDVLKYMHDDFGLV